MVKLDADHAGELIVQCQKLRKGWGENPHLFFEGDTVELIGQRFYKLGRITQRIRDDKVTWYDLKVIEDWLQELNAAQ